MNLTLLEKSGNHEHIYIISRYAYSEGNPILKDSDYDALHKFIKQKNSLPDYMERLYEDDPIPYKLLKKYGLLELVPENRNVPAHLQELLDNKSYSIYPTDDVQEAKGWFREKVGQEVILMLKVDGINVKSLYKRKEGNKFEHVVSSSRGRETDSLFDYTASLSALMPQNIQVETKLDTVPIYSEFYAKRNSLPYLSEKYKDFATPRSAGVSIARVPIDLEDYKHTASKVFRIEGLSDKLTESLDKADLLGFDTVYRETLVITEEFLDNFEYEITEILEKFYMHREINDIEAEGVVVEVNRAEAFAPIATNSMYTSSNIALKFGPFKSRIYKSKVIMPMPVQKRVKYSTVVTIEPTLTDCGNMVTRVNAFNPRRLIAENLLPGNDIYFEYKSQNSVNLISKAIGELKYKEE